MANYDDQMDMFEQGGLKDEGGSVDPVSGNDVPSGSTQSEVRDDIPAQLSEGEFVLPADVVRYIGLENIMKMRDMAKEGLAKMEAMGQMGNSEEATIDDTTDFDSDIDEFIEGLDKDDDDEPQEFAVGGLAGMGATTPEEQAAQIYRQTSGFGFLPSGVGFLPPGVTAPGVNQNLPQAPVIRPGGPGEIPGVPTYETKQYSGPNGEIRTFTFINGNPVTPIPEGFTLYDPSKIPEAKTGVPTASVGDGGDGPTQTQPNVDPLMGAARAISALNPDSAVGKAVADYDSRMMKIGIGALASAASGNIPGLVMAAYRAYKANEDFTNSAGPTIAKNNPTLSAVLGQTSNITSMSEADVARSIEAGLNMGMDPALAVAVTAAGGKIGTTPAVTEVDVNTGKQVTRPGQTSITGLTGSVENATRAMYGSLEQTDPQAFRDVMENAAFYDATGYGVMSTVTSPVSSATRAPTAPTPARADSLFDFAVAEEEGRRGLTTSPTSFSSMDTRSPEVQQLASDLNISPAAAAQIVSERSSGLTQQAKESARTPSRTVTTDSAFGSRSVSSGETVSFQGQDGRTTSVSGKSYTDATGNTRSGAFVDSNSDGVQQKSERSAVTSGSGSVVTDRNGNPVTSRSQAEIEAETGGSSTAGEGTYCCTKMVEHGLWDNKKELADMHNWHLKQPQWWRDGYDIWGKFLANTLLKTKSVFWTGVMQECYEYHIHNKKLNFKSVLGNAIMYSGVYVCGHVFGLTRKNANEV